MNKILNFEKYKSSLDENKIFAEKHMSNIENKFNEDLKKEYENIKKHENIDNFKFLMKNFNEVNNYLKSGYVTPKELQLISNKL